MTNDLRLVQIAFDDLLTQAIPELDVHTGPIEGWFAYKGDELIGVIGAELLHDSKSVMLHINMREDSRTPKKIQGFAWLIKEVIHPLFKARGFVRCVSNCSPEHTAVQKFMKLCGARLKTVVMAEYLL